jgi:hypothetical protein
LTLVSGTGFVERYESLIHARAFFYFGAAFESDRREALQVGAYASVAKLDSEQPLEIIKSLVSR